jgi:hypothetical protein
VWNFPGPDESVGAGDNQAVTAQLYNQQLHPQVKISILQLQIKIKSYEWYSQSIPPVELPHAPPAQSAQSEEMTDQCAPDIALHTGGPEKRWNPQTCWIHRQAVVLQHHNYDDYLLEWSGQ